ncbi:MAG: hypothetical protein U5K28_08670 [Halobacteriales archaeon]|nr:hypothetical protein [Halobacteriales archaeon]
MPTKSLAELEAQVGEDTPDRDRPRHRTGKVAEFARSIHDPADIYRRRDSRARGRVRHDSSTTDVHPNCGVSPLHPR